MVRGLLVLTGRFVETTLELCVDWKPCAYVES
jgi:hypothetical protein